MKALILRLWFLALLALVIPACFYDRAAGIVTDPKTGEIISADIEHSPIAKTAAAVDAVASVTPFGPFVHLGIEALLSALGIAVSVRGKQWKNAAIATATGVQKVVSDLDAAHVNTGTPGKTASQVADAIKSAIDDAHTAHDAGPVGIPTSMKVALSPTT